MQNSISSDDMGDLWEYPVFNCTSGFFLCLFFGLFVTRTGRISGPILTIYTSYDVLLPRMCLLGILFILLPI